MATTCKVCEEPLILHLEPDEEDDLPTSFPDDLELSCHCHFHWQCLLDQATPILSSFTCPSCSTSLIPSSSSSSSAQAQPPTTIPTTYTNEGGVQESLNILPDLKEEAYIESHPSARPARAIHVMAAEGDIPSILDLLRAVSEPKPERQVEDDDDYEDLEEWSGLDESQVAEMIRYQDPFTNNNTSLHLAVENFREEVVWLLLWIASSVPTTAFPEAARRDAESIGLQRNTASIGADLRSLENDAGDTAGDMARNLGGVWAPFIEHGVFNV